MLTDKMKQDSLSRPSRKHAPCGGTKTSKGDDPTQESNTQENKGATPKLG
jgi:hypothetical protein